MAPSANKGTLSSTSSSVCLLALVFLHISLTLCSPVPSRNDIISGQEFLSLFIAENPRPAATTESSSSLVDAGSLTDDPRGIPDDDEVDHLEADLDNDITAPDDTNSQESLSSTASVTSTTNRPEASSNPSTATPTSSNSRSKGRSLALSSSPAVNKRVIVRKFVNVHHRSRSATATQSTSTPPPPSPPTTTVKSQEASNYLDEDRVDPINSQGTSSLFIEETDAKDLTNSESMNVPRILPATSSSSSSSSSYSTSVAQGTLSKLLPPPPPANDVVLGDPSTDNETQQRNSPFTLQTESTTSSSGVSNSPATGEEEEDAVDDDDLVSNASNNDQLVQELRPSRSRTQQQIDSSSDSSSSVATPRSPAAAPTPPAPPTGVYGSPQLPPRSRLPISRSISSFPRREQRINAPPLPLYQAKVYSEPAKVYSEPAKVYSEPAKIYSEPAKVYGQPEKVYSEPAKFYSEPAKVYSEPAKIYSEPAKVYSEPAKNYGVPPTPFPVTPTTTTTTRKPQVPSTLTTRRVLFNLDKLPYDLLNSPNKNLDLQPAGGQQTEWDPSRLHKGGAKSVDAPPSKTDEVGEAKAEVVEGTGGKGQTKSAEAAADNNKTGYVVEGRTYRKYRVEEKTPDGFIVGEYGVVSHNDGNLRGVRYTADSNINPRLIYDALLKFLSL